MEVIETITALRSVTQGWRSVGERIAFVPTMGNLHSGHLKLVEQAKASADKVVVSIFVNPTQFGVGEDFAAYPRTEQADIDKLTASDVDLAFMPKVTDIYGINLKTVVSVSNLSTLHCGKFRPGHFDGVATVVVKLFNLVQPDVAVFGKKDFQQLVIIQTMVQDLNFPIVILPVETARESDGLALSSRNAFLNSDEREIAPKLYAALCAAKDDIMTGDKNFERIEHDAIHFLKNCGFTPDYFSVCNSEDLLAAYPQNSDLVILSAAKLGKTRLIDNVSFKINHSNILGRL